LRASAALPEDPSGGRRLSWVRLSGAPPSAAPGLGRRQRLEEVFAVGGSGGGGAPEAVVTARASPSLPAASSPPSSPLSTASSPPSAPPAGRRPTPGCSSASLCSRSVEGGWQPSALLPPLLPPSPQLPATAAAAGRVDISGTGGGSRRGHKNSDGARRRQQRSTRQVAAAFSGGDGRRWTGR